MVKHMPGMCCRNIQHSGGTHIVVALVEVIAVIADVVASVAIVALGAVIADVAIIALVAIVALVAMVAVCCCRLPLRLFSLFLPSPVSFRALLCLCVGRVHHGLLWFVAVLSPCHCLGSCHGGWRWWVACIVSMIFTM
jgi:hypothetical protein